MCNAHYLVKQTLKGKYFIDRHIRVFDRINSALPNPNRNQQHIMLN